MAAWLGIDGALGAFSAALVRDDGSAPIVASGAGNDALECGLQLVDGVLAATRLEELSGIAVGTGPGSFTGLRVALGYAKSLAFAVRLPLAGVSSYDALEASDARAPIVTFVHGRTGVACARFRSAAGETLIVCGEYKAIAARLASAIGGAETTVSAGAPAGAVSALGERGITVRPSALPSDVPAVAIAKRALAGTARAGSAHGVRADYGERAYFERPGATPAK